MSKVWLWILILAVVGLLIWWFAGDIIGGGTRDEPTTDVTTPEFTATNAFVIVDHSTISNACTIQTDLGTPEVHVYPGDWVYFTNNSTQDRTLTFGNARKLFDVNSLTIVSGQTDSLQIAADADAAGSRSPHTFRSCHPGIGPPKIIVCPPGTKPPC